MSWQIVATVIVWEYQAQCMLRFSGAFGTVKLADSSHLTSCIWHCENGCRRADISAACWCSGFEPTV